VTDKTKDFMAACARAGRQIDAQIDVLKNGTTVYDRAHALFSIAGAVLEIEGMTNKDFFDLLNHKLRERGELFESTLNEVLEVK
jgi:hypothetical protein